MNLKHIRSRRNAKAKSNSRLEPYCPLCKLNSLGEPKIVKGAVMRICQKCGFEMNVTPKEKTN
jgi:transposase-like protein